MCGVLLLSLAMMAQQGTPGSTVSAPTPKSAPVDAKKAQLREDSAKLAKAAAELKALLLKTDENTMSIEVIKKSEEVQRLAKQVQKEMKQQ